MVRYAIYNKITGMIRVLADTPPSVIDIQCNLDEDFFLNCGEGYSHIIDNTPCLIIPTPAPLTVVEILQKLTNAVQTHLDIAAKTRNYDNMLSLCSYSNSLDSVFAAEGTAGIVWRDACWRKCYDVMAAVQANTRSIPTEAELIAEMPLMVWPV